VRYGLAFAANHHFAWKGDDWLEVNNSWLATALTNQHGSIHAVWMKPPEDADPEELSQFSERIGMLLKTRVTRMQTVEAELFTQRIAEGVNPDSVALASAVLAHPDLLRRLPHLDDPAFFATPAAELMFRVAFEDAPPAELVSLYRKVERQSSLGDINEHAFTAVRQLLDAHHWTYSGPLRPSTSYFTDIAIDSVNLD
jgi:hypothetical protein